MKQLLSFLFVLSVLQTSFAQTSTDSIREINLKTVVLTAQYAPQSEKNAIYKVDVLGAKDIHIKSANNLKELLGHELNIDLTQNSVFGSGISIQGLSKENVKILLDGVPVIGRLNGIIDLTQIDLTNVEKIEVIEGPVSVFYGTDASAGTINLISKKNTGKKVSGGLSTYYESIDAKKAAAHLELNHKRESMQVFGKIYQFGGLSTLPSVRNLNWEKRHQYATALKYTHHFDNLNFNYTGRLSKEKSFYLGEPDTTNNAKDIDYFTKRIDNVLNLSGKIFDNKYIDANLAYQYYLRNHQTYNVDLTNDTRELSTKARDIDTSEFKLVFHRVQLGKNDKNATLNYAIGYDINLESAAGKRIKDKEQSMQTYAAFASINYKAGGKVEFQPGLRYTHNSTYGSLLTPALNIKWTINDNSILRFSYANGFRAPTIKELYLDFHIGGFVITGNTGLEAEKSHSANLYYTYYGTVNNRQSLTIEPSAFYNEISNLIALSAFAPERHYINVDNYKSVGGKIKVSYEPNTSLLVKTGFSLTGRQNSFAEETQGKQFLFSPEWNGSINYEIESLGLNLGIYYKYTGKREAFYKEKITHEVKATTRDAYHNLDFSANKRFVNDKFIVSLGAKNLLDVKNIDILTSAGEAHDRDLYLWGRSFYGKIQFEF